MFEKLANYLFDKREDVVLAEYLFRGFTLQVLELIIILVILKASNVFIEGIIVLCFLLVSRFYIFTNRWHSETYLKCVFYTTLLVLLFSLIGKNLGYIYCPILGTLLGYVTQKRKRKLVYYERNIIKK